MELVSMANLFAIRNAIVAGKVRNMTLERVNDLIAYCSTHEFVPYNVSAQIDEALDAVDIEAARGGRTLH